MELITNQSWDNAELYRLQTHELPKFYDENMPNFTVLGTQTLCKEMKIPYGYFITQQETFRKDILREQLRNVDTNQFGLIKRDDSKFHVVSKWSDHLVEDTNTFGINETNGWLNIVDDPKNEQKSFVLPTSKEKTNYNSSTFIDTSTIFYKKIELGLGLFKLICTNGARDRMFTDSISFSIDDFFDKRSIIMQGMIEAVSKLKDKYQQFIDNITKYEFTPINALQYLDNLEDKNLLHKLVIKEIRQQIVDFNDGKEASYFISNLGSNDIKTLYDFFDLTTYIINQTMKTVSQRSSAQKLVFDRFIKDFNIKADLNNKIKLVTN